MAQFEEEFEVTVTWWPFELHPETPAAGVNVDEILRRTGRGRAYSENLKAYAAEAGLKLASNRWLANSHRSLELAEFARDRGKFAAVHEALFRAYFEDAQDIGSAPVLEAIAAAAGLDVEEWKVETLLGRYAQLIDQTTLLARQKGVTSTPTIIFDDRMVVTGAQDYLVYQDVLRRLGAAPREPRHPGIV
ncbi:MAG: DsbA family protein [Chloroflexi bacterium]|nr:DsbA family protein [Chloroflexota bacterium]